MSNDDLMQMVKQAEELCEIKSYQEALALSEKIYKRWPANIQSLYIRGRTRWGTRNYLGALKDLDKAIALDGNFSKAYHFRGNALSDLKRYKEALASYDRAIELDPQYAEAYNGKGCTLDELERYDEALVCFDKAIELNPQFSKPYGNKGCTLDDLERYDEALVCYDKAIELNPQYASTYSNKGCTLDELERYDEALVCYDKAIELNPKCHEAFNNKGDTLRRMQLYGESLECFNRAIELDPNNTKYYNNRARLFQIMGQNKKAIIDYQKSSSLDVNNRFAEYKISLLEKLEELTTNEQCLVTTPPAKTTKSCLFPIERILQFHKDPRNIEIYKVSERKKADFAQFTAPPKDAINAAEVFHVLRRWNSYTPIINASGIHSRGGGYFLQLGRNGIVIDPGFDFIDNFMEAGYRFNQISKIFISHAHNDHDADLESILTLLYIYNKNLKENIKSDLEKKVEDGTLDGLKNMSNDALNSYIEETTDKSYQMQRKVIDIYLSVSAFKKHAARFNLSYREDYRIHVVDSENKEIACEKDVKVIPIPACHFDLLSDCDALGFIVEFPKFALVYTGDTGFTPQIRETYGAFQEKYQSNGKDIVLLAHIGGFKARENNPDEKHLASGEAFYKDHLGRNGLICLVDVLKPKYCILSEFGEELDGFRETLTELLTDTFADLHIPFIPADIGLCINADSNVCAITDITYDSAGKANLEEEFICASNVKSKVFDNVDSIVYYSSIFKGKEFNHLKGAVEQIRGRK